MVGRPSSARTRDGRRRRVRESVPPRAGRVARRLEGGAPPRPIRIPLLRTPGNRPPQRTQPAALSGAGRTAIWVPREGDARGPSRPGRAGTDLGLPPNALARDLANGHRSTDHTCTRCSTSGFSAVGARSLPPVRGGVRVADLRPNPHGTGAGSWPLATGDDREDVSPLFPRSAPPGGGVARCSRWGGGPSHSRGTPAPSKTSRKSRPCAPPAEGGKGSQRRRHQYLGLASASGGSPGTLPRSSSSPSYVWRPLKRTPGGAARKQ